MLNLKKYCLIAWLLLTGAALSGQKFYVSEAFRLRINEQSDIIGQQADFNFFTRSSEYEFDIIRLNAEMKNIRTLAVPLKERRAEVLYTGFVQKMLVIVYKYRVKSELCIKLLSYDTDLNFKDSLTMACFSGTSYNTQPKVVVSEDKQSLLLYSTHQSEYIQLWSFNLKEKKLSWSYRWDHELEKTEYRYFEKLLADNEGNAAMIFSEPAEGKNRYRISLAYLTGTGVIRQTFEEEHNKIYDADWLIDNKNKTLIQAGLFMQNKGFRAGGSIYRRVALALGQDSVFTVLREFETAKFTGFDSKKENYSNGLDDLSVVNIIMKQDGGAVVVLEKQQKNERSIRGRMADAGNTMRSLTDYYYDELYLMSLDANGNIEWLSQLVKKQFSQDDDADYSSVLVMKGADYLRLVYNDEITNENTLSQYLVQSDGRFLRKNIPNTDFRKLKIMFRKGRQVSANTVLIPCLAKNKLRYLKLEF